jgi:hypothetical protein
MRISYTVNEYDNDGDIIDTGIFLHFGDTRVKVAVTEKEFDEIVETMKHISEELKMKW